MRIRFLYISAFLAMLLLSSCHTAKKASTPYTEPIIKSADMPVTDSVLTRLLSQYPQYFDTILNNNDLWQAQFIYTQIDRDENNVPHFTHYYFNVDPFRYFYPASTVKLPAAILALQKLNQLQVQGLDKKTTMITDAAYSGQTAVYNDPTTKDGRPTVAHYIKKILLVSDNDAFNRLYEFLGQEYLNTTLHNMGYDSVQIRHRLSIALSEEENRYTNPVTFYDSAARNIYHQPLQKSSIAFEPRHQFLGKGYYKGDQLVAAPFDFSAKNRLALTDLHSILQSLMFPDAVPQKQRFHLQSEDYTFLYKYMSMAPRLSEYPQYDSSFNNAYVKFLFYGAKDPVDTSIRIFNKVGDAYGFLTDAAYIIDAKKGIEFLLSATIHCNSDGIYNDDHYDYDTIGLPFMKNLGRVIYDYESQRIKKVVPKFSSLMKP